MYKYIYTLFYVFCLVICGFNLFAPYSVEATNQVDSHGNNGGGYSYMFNELMLGSRLAEIRTPNFPSFKSYSFSFWARNMIPNSSNYHGHPGNKNGLLSYWKANDKNSTDPNKWGLLDGKLSNQNTPIDEPLFTLLTAGRSHYIIQFDQYQRIAYDIQDQRGVFFAPLVWDEFDNENWYFNVISFDHTTGQTLSYSWIDFNNTEHEMSKYSEPFVDVKDFPEGYWRIGYTSDGMGKLNALLDDFCFYNNSMDLNQMRKIREFGCTKAESDLIARYTFDKDREEIPNVYDEVSQTYNAVSTDKLKTPSECSAYGNPLKFPENIGPHKVISSSPSDTKHYIYQIPLNQTDPITYLGQTFSSFPAKLNIDDTTIEVVYSPPMPHIFNYAQTVLEGDFGGVFMPDSQTLVLGTKVSDTYKWQTVITEINSTHTLDVLDCSDCFSILFNEKNTVDYVKGINLLNVSLPYTIKDPYGRVVFNDVLSRHTTYKASSSYLIKYKYVNEFGYSTNEAIYNITVLGANAKPITKPTTLKLYENSDYVSLDLSSYISDRENDFLVRKITKIPSNVQLFQPDLTPITMEPKSGIISQWVSNASASSEWVGQEAIGLTGIPGSIKTNIIGGVFQVVSNWGPSGDDYMKTWIKLIFDKPVYAYALTIYYQYSPGSAVKIMSKDVIVYSGPINTKMYCNNDPLSPCVQKVRYDLFPVNFKSNEYTIFFELDNVDRRVSVSGVSLEGSINPDRNVINNIILIKPNKYFSGTDEFVFYAYDLDYFQKYQGLPSQEPTDQTQSTIKLNITHINNPPIFDPSDPILIKPSFTKQNINLTFYDVDNDIISLSIITQPSDGLITIENNKLYFINKPCNDVLKSDSYGIISASDYLNTSSYKLDLKLECDKLPSDYILLTNKNIARYVLPIIGFVIALVCLVFNIYNRNHIVVKSTSWKVNILIIFGTILIYASIYLFGLNSEDIASCISNDYPNKIISPECLTDIGANICQPRLALVIYGWILAFGSLFAKTYRVATLFNNKKLKKITVTDQYLFIMIGIGLILGSVYIGVWYMLNPPIGYFNYQSPFLDIQKQTRINNIIDVCSSNDYMIGLYVIFGVSLIYGAYLSYSIRNVKETIKVKNVNDSKEIMISMYNILIIAIAGFAITQFVNDPQINFIVVAICLFLCNTIMLLVLFVSKYISVINNDIPQNTTTTQSMTVVTTAEDNRATMIELEKLRAENENLKKQLNQTKMV